MRDSYTNNYSLSYHNSASGPMSFVKQLPKSLKELRVHMCQTSPSSQGLRYVFLSGITRIGIRKLMRKPYCLHAFDLFVEMVTPKLGSWPGINRYANRQFVLSNYPALKSSNPDLKVLIREARGIEPRVFARFGETRIRNVTLRWSLTGACFWGCIDRRTRSRKPNIIDRYVRERSFRETEQPRQVLAGILSVEDRTDRSTEDEGASRGAKSRKARKQVDIASRSAVGPCTSRGVFVYQIS
jgi:hypothetical protein